MWDSTKAVLRGKLKTLKYYEQFNTKKFDNLDETNSLKNVTYQNGHRWNRKSEYPYIY